MKTDLHIRTPEYGAGTTYRWEEEYGMQGIGIAKYKLNRWEKNRKEHLTIKVGNVNYKVKRSRLMNFHKNHIGSLCYKNSTLLYSFPLSIMEGPPIKKLTVPVEPQLNLFS